MNRNRNDLIRTIREFDWSNHGLDNVGEVHSDDWARALADEILDTPPVEAAQVGALDEVDRRAWTMVLDSAESVLEDDVYEDDDMDEEEFDEAHDRAMEIVDQLRTEKGIGR